MKLVKLFAVAVVATVAFASCGGGASDKAADSTVVAVDSVVAPADSTPVVADSAAAPVDSTKK